MLVPWSVVHLIWNPSLPNTLWGSVFGPTNTSWEGLLGGSFHTDPHKVWRYGWRILEAEGKVSPAFTIFGSSNESQLQQKHLLQVKLQPGCKPLQQFTESSVKFQKKLGGWNQKDDPPWKLTWHWKIRLFNRKFICKWWIFHCHVSF